MPQLQAKVVAVKHDKASIQLLESSEKCTNCHSGCSRQQAPTLLKKTITIKNNAFVVGDDLRIDLPQTLLTMILLAKTILPFLLFVLAIVLFRQSGELLAFGVGLGLSLAGLFSVSKIAGIILASQLRVEKVYW